MCLILFKWELNAKIFYFRIVIWLSGPNIIEYGLIFVVLRTATWMVQQTKKLGSKRNNEDDVKRKRIRAGGSAPAGLPGKWIPIATRRTGYTSADILTGTLVKLMKSSKTKTSNYAFIYLFVNMFKVTIARKKTFYFKYINKCDLLALQRSVIYV